MKVTLVCINFHCEDAITAMLGTIVPDSGTEIAIVLVDNSQTLSAHPAFSLDGTLHDVSILDPGSNLGYLGAFAWAVRKKSLHTACDIVILANPDLEFSVDFFSTLRTTTYDDDIAIIAPDITNMPSRARANPAMTKRPTRSRMWLRKHVHSNRYFYAVYDLLHRIKRRLRRSPDDEQPVHGLIYAPHGALMLFRSSYFAAGGSLDYFSFLFGEEIFVAEEARRIGKSVLFDPQLKAVHHEHVATRALGSSKLSRFSHESLVRIYDVYFRRYS